MGENIAMYSSLGLYEGQIIDPQTIQPHYGRFCSKNKQTNKKTTQTTIIDKDLFILEIKRLLFR